MQDKRNEIQKQQAEERAGLFSPEAVNSGKDRTS